MNDRTKHGDSTVSVGPTSEITRPIYVGDKLRATSLSFYHPLHFSIALICCDKEGGEEEETNTMGRLRAKSDYEDIRNARILENQVSLSIPNLLLLLLFHLYLF